VYFFFFYNFFFKKLKKKFYNIFYNIKYNIKVRHDVQALNNQILQILIRFSPQHEQVVPGRAKKDPMVLIRDFCGFDTSLKIGGNTSGDHRLGNH
jgi:hypothetical protein